MTRLRYLVSPSDARRGFGADGDELLSVSIHRGVVPRRSETDDLPRADDLANYKVVRRGDIVVNRMRAFQGAVGRSEHDGIVSPDYTVLQPGPKVDSHYLNHLFRSRWFVGEMVARLRGIGSTDTGSVRTPRINWEDLGEIDVSPPPLAEQQAIADYLDAETARIDALIAKKQQLIHLLEERRTQLTLSEVTGRGHSKRKASGLAWAESVPAHWRVGLLRLVADQGTGHTPSREHPEWWVPSECTIPWVTTGEVQQVRSDRVRTIYETREKISPLGVQNSSAKVHPAGTVFLCRTASAGYSGIMGVDMATSQDFATWTCGEFLEPEFLLHCIRAMRADLLGRLATGSTHKTIYMPDVQALKIPVPSVAEQQKICRRLNVVLSDAFAVSDALQRQLGLLGERRQSLISACVTGASPLQRTHLASRTLEVHEKRRGTCSA